MSRKCQETGCALPVPDELRDPGVCLAHFLERTETRARRYAVEFTAAHPPEDLRQPALQFAFLAAAQLATLGVQHPPDDPLLRNRLLHVMLMLADLREQLERGHAAPRG